jgi:aryl-alcohol dehydrogenase-like predicted oxidoreductase
MSRALSWIERGTFRAGVLGQQRGLKAQASQYAEAKGITAGQFAVSWVLNSSFVSAVIAGPRTEEQWDDYIRALDYRFTAEDEALVDRLVTSGHPSTPGFNDPAYPIEGRRARTAR